MMRSVRAARLMACVTSPMLVAAGTATAHPGQDEGGRHRETALAAEPLPLGPDDLPEERITRCWSRAWCTPRSCAATFPMRTAGP